MTDAPRPECDECGAPTGDSARLCRTHVTALTSLLRAIGDSTERMERWHLDAFGRDTFRDLRDRQGGRVPYQPSAEKIYDERVVPGIASELAITIARQDKLGLTSDAPSSSEKPLNWNERASIIAVELNSTVNAWSLEVSRKAEDERDPLVAIHHTDTGEVALWLSRNVHILALHEQAGVAYDELRNAYERALGAIDRPKNRTTFLVGPCPEKLGDIQVEPCPGEVWAYIPTSENDPALMRCQYPECGAAWNTTQWLRAAKRIMVKMEELRRKGIRFPYEDAA